MKALTIGRKPRPEIADCFAQEPLTAFRQLPGDWQPEAVEMIRILSRFATLASTNSIIDDHEEKVGNAHPL